MARALLFQSHLPIQLWDECVLTAGYLINRTPSLVLNCKNPHELLYKTFLTYAHFRVFGSLCYAHNQNHQGDKFALRTRRAFVGYPHGQKGGVSMIWNKNNFLVSRDVVFTKTQFPFKEDNISEGEGLGQEAHRFSNPLTIGTHIFDLDGPSRNLGLEQLKN